MGSLYPSHNFIFRKKSHNDLSSLGISTVFTLLTVTLGDSQQPEMTRAHSIMFTRARG